VITGGILITRSLLFLAGFEVVDQNRPQTQHEKNAVFAVMMNYTKFEKDYFLSSSPLGLKLLTKTDRKPSTKKNTALP